MVFNKNGHKDRDSSGQERKRTHKWVLFLNVFLSFSKRNFSPSLAFRAPQGPIVMSQYSLDSIKSKRLRGFCRMKKEMVF